MFAFLSCFQNVVSGRFLKRIFGFPIGEFRRNPPGNFNLCTFLHVSSLHRLPTSIITSKIKNKTEDGKTRLLASKYICEELPRLLRYFSFPFQFAVLENYNT